MKRRKVLISLLIVIVLCTPCLKVIADQEVYDQIHNFNIRIHSGVGNFNTFYSNYTRMFYVVFGDEYNGIAGMTYVTRYCWSYDGISWNNYTQLETNEGVGAIEYYGIENQDMYLTPDGTQLYYVNLNNEDGRPYEVDYRVYNLSLNGDLDLWIEEIDIAVPCVPVAWTPENSISITVDNETRPYVSFESIDGALSQNNAVLFRGAYTNGSWISHTSRTQWHNDITGGAGASELFFIDLLNTGDLVTATGIGRGVKWLVHWDTVIGVGEALDTDLGINYYDGNGWDVDGIGGLGMEDAESQWERRSITLANVGNITVLAKMIEDLVAPDRKRIDLAFKEGKNAWQNRTTGSFTILGDIKGDGMLAPYLGIDNQTDFILLWTVAEPDGNRSIWYRRGNAQQIMTNATWAWQTPITLWQNVTSTDGFNDELYNSGGMHEMLPYNVPFSMSWLFASEDGIWHDYIFTEDNGELDLPTQHYNSTLINSASGLANDGWIFEGEMYEIISFFTGADIFYLNFSDGQHTIRFRFDYSTEQVYVESLDDQFVIGDIFTNYTLHSDGTQETIWRFIPDINIVDDVDVEVDYYTLNSTTGFNTTGSTGIEFNIYNLGGNTYYNFEGDGARVIGGTPFQLNATDGNAGSLANASQIFRKLQHISFLMELEMSNEWDAGNGEFDIDAGVGYVDIGIDYRLNGSWVEGFFVRIYVQDADVGHHNANNDHNWVEWSVDFYNYDPATGTQQNLQSQLIYSNHYGYANENLSPDYHNRTSTQLWIDLWIDRTNASTTVGAQVNSYYYGMREHGSSWWFGYGVFQPMISDYDNAKFLDDLYDEGGNITNCQKFDIMRYYVEVGKVDIADGNDEPWYIRSIEDMHRELAIDRMQGIDEPTFVETKVLDMPQTGFINALKSAINGLSKLIWGGAFQFIKLIMGAMGYLMESIGLGEWWLAFSAMLSDISTYSLNLMEQLETALINSAILLNQIFLLLTSGFTRFTYGLTRAISSLLSWYTYMVDMFTGGGIFNINIWAGLAMGDFLLLGIHLIPVFWIQRLAKADDLIRTIQGDLSFALMIITGLFNFMVTIIMLSIALLNFLIGLLPI